MCENTDISHKQTHPVTKLFQQHFDHPLYLLLILRWEGRSEHTFSVLCRATPSTQSIDCTTPAIPLKNFPSLSSSGQGKATHETPYVPEGIRMYSFRNPQWCLLPGSGKHTQCSPSALSSTGIHCTASQGSSNGNRFLLFIPVG